MINDGTSSPEFTDLTLGSPTGCFDIISGTYFYPTSNFLIGMEAPEYDFTIILNAIGVILGESLKDARYVFEVSCFLTLLRPPLAHS